MHRFGVLRLSEKWNEIPSRELPAFDSRARGYWTVADNRINALNRTDGVLVFGESQRAGNVVVLAVYRNVTWRSARITDQLVDHPDFPQPQNIGKYKVFEGTRDLTTTLLDRTPHNFLPIDFAFQETGVPIVEFSEIPTRHS
ncbi:MAG: hypothetical protein AAB263_00035 [Planctomycetota bacterium]